jgi:hypothetical protein
MSTELDHLRAFRVEEATVDDRARDSAREALLERIQTARAAPRGSAGADPRSRRRRLIVSAGGLATAAAAAVAVAVAAVAIILVGRSPRVSDSVKSSGKLQQLIEPFAVFRRSQTAAERRFDPLERPFARRRSARHRRVTSPILPALTRLATTLPDGERIYLTVERGGGFATGQQPPAYSLGLWVVTNRRDLGGSAQHPNIGGDVAPNVGSRRIAPPAPLLLGRTASTWTSLLPDGVTRVRWVFPRQNGNRTHVYPRPLTIDVAVHGNVAAARLPRTATWEPVIVIWYAADGRVIKTYAGAYPNRVLPPFAPHPR